MDRIIHSGKQKPRLFKEFEYIDIIPYSIALLLLLAEGYILWQFLHLYAKMNY